LITFFRSFGCVLFEMVKLERLFKETNEYLLMKEIIDFDVEKIQDKTIDEIFRLILKK